VYFFVKRKQKAEELMNRTIKPQSAVRLSRLTVSLGLLLAFGAAQPMVASAATITVTNPTDAPIPFTCNLRQAIVAHNEKKRPFPSNCTAGDGNDIIVIGRFAGERIVDLGSPLRAIENGTVTIRPVELSSVCVSLRQSAYMTVNSGATLNLEGIGIVVNGAEFRSAIDNNGGILNIFPHKGSLRCLFSNQLGRDRKTTLGGVLNNRSGGTATIDANFKNSAAADRGGAINVDSGTVVISGGSFNNNNAPRGGAIFVNNGAILNIKSSNFSISNNSSSKEGGAIYSLGGIVSLQRSGGTTPTSVRVASNRAPSGGAISADGGKLSIDGIQFLDNTAVGAGGAIILRNLPLANAAAITHTYFRDNASQFLSMEAIRLTGGSTLILSGDTFLRDRVYVNSVVESDLNVINSTFLGGGIHVQAGAAKVTFSTIVSSRLFGPPSQFSLSNSILSGVQCTNVADDAGNLAFHSAMPGAGCPGHVDDPKLDPEFLKDNGGPTPTIALLAGSPAIDQINAGHCLDLSGKPLTIDQRDASRPFPSGGLCDIGAYEFGATATPALLPPGWCPRIGGRVKNRRRLCSPR
jgi:predicted outer membrane repeat protein